jgi:hypothetical protein
VAVPAGYRKYGADPGAFAATIASNPTSPQPILSAPGTKFWVRQTEGGIRVTNLFNAAGTAVTEVTADAQGFIVFWAPPGLGSLWIEPLNAAGVGIGVYTVLNPATLADQVEEQAVSKLNATGSKQIAGPTAFDTRPTVGGVGVLLEGEVVGGDFSAPDDAEDFSVPAVVGGDIQWLGALRFPEPDADGVAWVVDAGGTLRGIKYVTTVQPPTELTLTHEWINPPTTGPDNPFWPSSTPSGVDAVSHSFSAIVGDTQSAPDAWGAGQNGYLIGNDVVQANYGVDYLMTPENDTHDLIVMRLKDAYVDTVDASTDGRRIWMFQLMGFRADGVTPARKMGISLGWNAAMNAWTWYLPSEEFIGAPDLTGHVPATQTPNAGNTGIDPAMTVALDLHGATSRAIIVGGGSTERQIIPIDLSGIASYNGINLDGHLSGVFQWRGRKTVKLHRRYSGLDLNQVDEAIDLAAA